MVNLKIFFQIFRGKQSVTAVFILHKCQQKLRWTRHKWLQTSLDGRRACVTVPDSSVLVNISHLPLAINLEQFFFSFLT